jgi:hypothetical protein
MNIEVKTVSHSVGSSGLLRKRTGTKAKPLIHDSANRTLRAINKKTTTFAANKTQLITGNEREGIVSFNGSIQTPH